MPKIKKNTTYRILSIDTSCDETSVSITQNDCVISNVISSQVDLHRKWGGVVPMIAKRAHLENINEAVSEALRRAKVKIEDLDAIAVTYGPGLAIALEVGIDKAKKLVQKFNKPLIIVNHMEGHLLSSLVKNSKGKSPNTLNIQDKSVYPSLGLLVSGGHTELIQINDFGVYQKIGQTVDDAAGEAFDKFANMLDLGYPGGEIVEKFALLGDKNKYVLPRPMVRSGDLNYSFSGLKTAAMYLIKDLKKAIGQDFLPKEIVYDLCASFQQAVVDSLIIKFKKALEEIEPKYIFCGGGVFSNKQLRKELRRVSREYSTPVLFPMNQKLSTDNAAMIGLVAYYKFLRQEFADQNIETLERNPNLSL